MGSAVLLLLISLLFYREVAIEWVMIFWVACFLLATSGASAAHLCISELFP